MASDWQDVREAYLKRLITGWRDFMDIRTPVGYCECCKEEFLLIDLSVHHLNPRALRPDLALDPMNLLAVCGRCHDMMDKFSFSVLNDIRKEFARENRQTTSPADSHEIKLIITKIKQNLQELEALFSF